MAGCSGLLQCFASIVAGMGIISLCWSMLRPLWLIQHFDLDIADKQGMYVALPIYGYLRRYFLILLLAGGVVSLISIVALVSDRCTESGPPAITAILTVLFGTHIPTIGAFEISKRHRRPGQRPFVARLVEHVQKRLYGIAVFLLLAIALIAMAS